MKKTLLILVIIMLGCNIDQTPEYEKPFMIIKKERAVVDCGEGYCQYDFQDVNGNRSWFCGKWDEYTIGDIIE